MPMDLKYMGDCGEGIGVPVYLQNCKRGDLVPKPPGGLLLGGGRAGLRRGTLSVANVSRET